MTAIQIVLICFSVFALSRAVGNFRRGALSLFQLICWTLFWAGAIVVVALPSTTTKVADWLGVGRGVDVAIYLALMGLFYMVFRMFGKIDHLEREITRVVRADALRVLDDMAPLAPRDAPPEPPRAAGA
jgi:hypothetical protein